MYSPNLASRLDSLKSILDNTEAATSGNIELIGHWGRYICILTAGFLEIALRELYSEFAKSSSSPQVARFASQVLARISNPKAWRFVETAKSFDPGWADELKGFLDADGGRRRDSIDSIMNNRNQIAHGGNAQVSVGRIREHLPNCIQVIEFIECQLLGNMARG